MSHTINQLNNNLCFFVSFTIVNYVAGGESVLPTEFPAPITQIDAVVFGTVPATGNSLATPLLPLLEGGKVKLIRWVGGVPTEIPTTNALNATVWAVVHTNQV
jgi:hypothetical protein